MDINLKIDIRPLTVNQAFTGRHFKTQACRDYEKELWILLPKRAMVNGEVEVWFDFFLKNYATTDISNLVKVTEDILVKKGYIQDDRKVVKMHLSKTKSGKDMMCIKIKKHAIL